MAAAIKALNAKIRSNKYSDYFCSTRTFLPGHDSSSARMRKRRIRCRLQRRGCGCGYKAERRYIYIYIDHVADFWGPASNFGIPIAAIADMSKDPEMLASLSPSHSSSVFSLANVKKKIVSRVA